ARAHLALMPRRRVPELLESELVLLQLDVRGHRARSVAPREVEHRGIQGVEAGEGDELELVAPAAEGLLEACDRVVVEVLTPIERRRARSEEHTSELQSRGHLVCRLLLEKKKKQRVS